MNKDDFEVLGPTLQEAMWILALAASEGKSAKEGATQVIAMGDDVATTFVGAGGMIFTIVAGLGLTFEEVWVACEEYANRIAREQEIADMLENIGGEYYNAEK